MIEREIAENFLNKQVVLTVDDDERHVFRRGLVTAITSSTLLLQFQGNPQAYSLSFIQAIRLDERRE